MFGFGKQRASVQEQTIDAVFVSETGLVRKDNQDNVLVSVAHGVFCVADGMGGGAEGAKASATVCHELKLMTHVSGATFAERISAVRASIVDANAAIYAYACDRGFKQMGSTALVMVTDPEDSSHAAVLYVGDSRLYRIRGGLVSLLTRDHSVGRELSDFAGAMAADFRSRANPLTHILTRAVGVHPTVQVDEREFDVRQGDRFVLCTDGVHDVVSDARLGVFAAGGTLESAASRLAAEVVRCGAPDNYSFVLVCA
ncbi:MAG: serine/threonine-protein phosphatase [Kiritimatiellae bacterium]|nr:serine/threonine-protein phosphatase [Kiritimatiellia bacterium]